MIDKLIAAYDRAWNEPDADTRIALLRSCLTEGAELVDPQSGPIRGREAISARIGGFADRFPGARVTITSDVDEHNGFARYSWTITDRDDQPILRGLDVVERADDQRLRRVIMFFGELRRPVGWASR